jgi:hypothetical protein
MMSYLPGDEANPFRAPAARIGDYSTDVNEIDRGEAESIRRVHINHEASIKTLGMLYYIGTGFGIFGAIGLLVLGSGLVPLNQGNQANQAGMSPQMMQGFFLGMAVFYIALSVLQGFLGYGLRAFQVWARWTVIVLTALSLLYVLVVSLMAALTQPLVGLFVLVISSLIPAYILYLMASSKGSMIFSAEYKDIIRKTPHVKAKTSLLVKIVLVLLVALILFIIVAAIMAPKQ